MLLRVKSYGKGLRNRECIIETINYSAIRGTTQKNWLVGTDWLLLWRILYSAVVFCTVWFHPNEHCHIAQQAIFTFRDCLFVSAASWCKYVQRASERSHKTTGNRFVMSINHGIVINHYFAISSCLPKPWNDRSEHGSAIPSMSNLVVTIL